MSDPEELCRLPSPAHQSCTEATVPRQSFDCGGQIRWIAGTEKHTVLPVGEELPRAASACCNHGCSACHGLERDETEGLVPFTREDADVGIGVGGDQPGSIGRSNFEPFLDAE